MAGAALILACLTAGCERTTPGTVAMTTQPGPPITSTTRTPTDGAGAAGHPHTGHSDPRVSQEHRRSGGSRAAERADHDNAASSTSSTRPPGWPSSARSWPQENNPLGPNGESVGQMLVEAACQFLPEATVSEVLMGTPPR